jgi:uncharacterized membrane protein YkgB
LDFSETNLGFNTSINHQEVRKENMMNIQHWLRGCNNALDVCLQTLDVTVVRWLQRYGITLLRLSVGIIFIWFGALKLVPGLSPAEPLIRALMPDVIEPIALPAIALMEIVIGLGYLSGRYLRVVIILNLLQMAGAMSPLLFVPERLWEVFPFVWTLEGQYVIKDIILVSAALVIGSTVRGARLVTQTQMMRAVKASDPRATGTAAAVQ